MKAKAAKCLLNLMNPFDAITDTRGSEEFTRCVRGEAEQIWNAAGIEWEPVEEYSKRSQLIRPPSTPSTEKKSSTWQSLARGTGNVEAGQINGDLVKLGRFLGMEAPYNECLWRVSTDMALKNEKPGRYSRSDLERMIAGRSWPAPASR
jgi:2-dehydropantoate 2-reductase